MELKNRVIVEGAEAAKTLGRFSLPWKTSLAVARLSSRLDDLMRPIEATRLQKLQDFVKRDDKGNPIMKADGKTFELYDELKWQMLFQELMNDVTQIDGTLPKFKLPETVPVSCDQCKHNMDRPFEVPPLLLVPLLQFIEE